MSLCRGVCLVALILSVSCGGSDTEESSGGAAASGTETATDESGSDGDIGSTDESGSDGDIGSTDVSGSADDTGSTDESGSDSGSTDEGSGDVGTTTSDGGESSLGNLLFASGFEPDTEIIVKTPTYDRFSGKDNSVAEKGDWVADLVEGNPYIGSAKIFYEDKEGDRDKRRAELVTDGSSTYLRYLIKRAHVEIVSPHDPNKKEIKGRIQLGLNNLEGLKEFTYRVKIRLAGGFNALTQAPQPITWMTISE
ncbi:MAG TPA: hypothetical protein EYN66_23580, partial [Myxococcales bacterium]|nr:hypothetical protein [Myxococcales bacterium]